MLEITKEDISRLNDDDLRSLVGRLCEAELKARGLSVSAVTWSGNQNAADGGIDVRVEIKDGEAPLGFVPRTSVGYQVKKTDFTPALITQEMAPDGQLRASIKRIIDEGGAYIIVSSGSDTSDSALSGRLRAMKSVVADQVGHDNIHLDFYDCNRLATWTRNYPGIVAWVRQQTGRSIPGWQPYGLWAASPDGMKDEYLLDGTSRLHAGVTDEEGMSIAVGIAQLRSILRQPRNVIRLAGLSGVGKTRLVQTLFDDRVANDCLSPALAIYADMQDHPSPPPTAMISDLVATRARAIVVVDNCPSDLHRRITELCKSPESLVSVITVEYDIQDDEPEGTRAYRLEPSSNELIARLVEQRHPTMDSLDAERIAEFAGGNSRIAFALANTLEDRESVAGLRDEELFKRLFHQRQTPDGSLLKAGQACALLYSFQGEALDGEDAELPMIAALAGMSVAELYSKVALLKQRDLVQSRSVWRAILPHAIANRLATAALHEIPSQLIEQQFNTPRLKMSYCRRLGFLHENDAARKIVQGWLSKEGLFSDLGSLNDIGFKAFENISPVSPEDALAAIERTLDGVNADRLTNDASRRNATGAILQLIAYDASLFERCVAAMCPLVLAEEESGGSHPIRNAVKTLFHLQFSGTRATVDQRVRCVESLMESGDLSERQLGLTLLNALLEEDDFVASYRGEFGARVQRDEYKPNNKEDVAHWFATGLQIARHFAIRNDEQGSDVRSIVAQSIGGLWFLGDRVQEEIEALAEDVVGNEYWHEGWVATRYKLSRLSKSEKKNTAAFRRLRLLERSLRPQSLFERVRAVVLSNSRRTIDYADLESVRNYEAIQESHEKAWSAAEELGKAVCDERSLLNELLPELVGSDGRRLFPFGRGLALASDNRRNLWKVLTAAFVGMEEEKRNASVLGGFLNGVSSVDQALSEVFLEESLTHPTLGAWFPGLQHAVPKTLAGKERLVRAAQMGVARPDVFSFLQWEQITEVVSASDLRSIIMALAAQKSGYRVAIDILAAQIDSLVRQKREPASELVDAGRALLSNPDFSETPNNFGYELKTVADACLRGSEGAPSAQALCNYLKEDLPRRIFRADDLEELIKSLFANQPRVSLDAFFEGANAVNNGELVEVGSGLFSHRRKQPIDRVPLAVLLEWCDENPDHRYLLIARFVSFEVPSDAGVTWTPQAMEVLKRSPDPSVILDAFVKRFVPRRWSGSRAATLESRLNLLDRPSELHELPLAGQVATLRRQLVERIAEMRRDEDDLSRYQDERFE